jgi:hypothetical protein
VRASAAVACAECHPDRLDLLFCERLPLRCRSWGAQFVGEDSEAFDFDAVIEFRHVGVAM